MSDLPCDTEGRCMVCKNVPPDCDVLLCNSCSSPWHMQCLHPPLESVPSGDWSCPDCSLSPPSSLLVDKPSQAPASEVVSRILAIQADDSLTEVEKAKRRQEIMGKGLNDIADLRTAPPQSCASKNGESGNWNPTLKFLDHSLDCIFCMQLADRPVTTPCGHNFCLKCFQKWISQGKKTCGKCRAAIPAKMASQPRINAALVIAIRMAKAAKSNSGPPKVYQHRDNDSRPDKCFTTSRAVKTGKANACSGKIFITCPPDHFGPIAAENDPTRNQGILVGESWEDRLECRQWGAHLPHVAGIAGQSDYGSQSVALSGGYEDDEDHGEWFLYTGSGGRDLSGNKRTNKEQAFDQKFDKLNEALRISCREGYPVRVVRSHKEKRSCYAPETGVRYDGVYRVEKCWIKKGIQGYQVCRYLFVRCDNEPAPWTSDEQGDRPRPMPEIEELKIATDIFDRQLLPSWDFKECGEWGWMREPPPSRKIGKGSNESAQKRKQLSIQQRLLKEFGCGVCRKVLQEPLSMPCGHNFCKPCLDATFGQQSTRERTGVSGRPLRTQKVMKRCPTCNADISDYLITPQINRQMEEVIQTLQNTPVDHSSDTNEAADEIGDDCKSDSEHDAAGSPDALTQQNEHDIEKQIPANTKENSDSTDRTAGKTLETGEDCGRVVSSAPQPAPKVEGNGNVKSMAQCVPVPDPAYKELCKGDQEGDIKDCSKPTSTLQKRQKESKAQGKRKPTSCIPSEAGKATLEEHANPSKEPATAAGLDKSDICKRTCVDSDVENHTVGLKSNGHIAKKAQGNVDSEAENYTVDLKANGHVAKKARGNVDSEAKDHTVGLKPNGHAAKKAQGNVDSDVENHTVGLKPNGHAAKKAQGNGDSEAENHTVDLKANGHGAKKARGNVNSDSEAEDHPVGLKKNGRAAKKARGNVDSDSEAEDHPVGLKKNGRAAKKARGNVDSDSEAEDHPVGLKKNGRAAKKARGNVDSDSEAEDHPVGLKKNGHAAKKIRANVPALPPRITRSRVCVNRNNGDITAKKLQGALVMVEVSSDSDFE